MPKPVLGSQFRRDVKLAQKRGWNMGKLRDVIQLLVAGGPLPVRYKDHPLLVTGSTSATAMLGRIGC